MNDPLALSDLDFLIDSSQLMANAHQNWASMLERDVEEPLIAGLTEIPRLAKRKQQENTQKIEHLIQQLHSEEDTSYKMKKKKTRDLQHLHQVILINQSLNIRMGLADEIKRLSIQNETISDSLAQERVPFILQLLSKAVDSKLETFETIQEGFNKVILINQVGSSSIIKKPDGFRTRHSCFSGRTMDSGVPTQPDTEIIPNSRHISEKEMNMEFMRATLANLS